MSDPPEPDFSPAFRRLERLAARLRADRGIDLSATELAALLASARLRAQLEASGEPEEPAA